MSRLRWAGWAGSLTLLALISLAGASPELSLDLSLSLDPLSPQEARALDRAASQAIFGETPAADRPVVRFRHRSLAADQSAPAPAHPVQPAAQAPGEKPAVAPPRVELPRTAPSAPALEPRPLAGQRRPLARPRPELNPPPKPPIPSPVPVAPPPQVDLSRRVMEDARRVLQLRPGHSGHPEPAAGDPRPGVGGPRPHDRGPALRPHRGGARPIAKPWQGRRGGRGHHSKKGRSWTGPPRESGERPSWPTRSGEDPSSPGHGPAPKAPPPSHGSGNPPPK